jgi:hypothetical protein
MLEICMEEVPGSNLDRNINDCKVFMIFIPVLPGKCWYSTLNQATTALFDILSSSISHSVPYNLSYNIVK